MNIDFNSESFRKAAEKFVRKHKHKEDIKRKYIELFRSLPLEKRVDIITRIKNKYESDEYTRRWYDRGIEPPMDLLFLYFDYAAIYGTDVSDEYNDEKYPKHFMFTAGIYRTEERFIIELLIGQGSAVKIYTDDELREWLTVDFEHLR